MFRFWCSEFSSNYRWKAIEATSCEGLITKYHQDNLWTYDCDDDGEGEVIFAITPPGDATRFFRLKYEWIMTFEGDEAWVENPFLIEEITREDAPGTPGDRDWLVIPKTSGCRSCGRP